MMCIIIYLPICSVYACTAFGAWGGGVAYSTSTVRAQFMVLGLT